jgi:hypothetical protein
MSEELVGVAIRHFKNQIKCKFPDLSDGLLK